MPFERGRTKTGGRRKGVQNQRTRKLQAEIVRDGVTPLDYMLKVLRSPKETQERKQWAAQTAAPFLHPRLQVVDSRTVVEVKTAQLSADELRARARAAIAAAFAERPPLVEGEYHHVVAGKDTADMLPAPQKQANGEASDEREG
jgi:hypothetical protein